MRRNSHLAAIVGFALSAVLLVSGGLLLWGSTYIHNTVQGQLAAQQIYFPPQAAFAHPKAGSVTAMGVPIRLWETPGAALAPAPLLGEHTDEILTSLLRIPKATVHKLRAAGVV